MGKTGSNFYRNGRCVSSGIIQHVDSISAGLVVNIIPAIESGFGRTEVNIDGCRRYFYRGTPCYFGDIGIFDDIK